MSDELIRRQDALEALGEEPSVWNDSAEEIAERNQWRRDVNAIKAVPAEQPEITDDQVIEYCRKRHLVVLDTAFYHELFDSYMRQSADRLMKEGEL